MSRLFVVVCTMLSGLLLASVAVAQEGETTDPAQEQPAHLLEQAREHVEAIAVKVDEQQSAQAASAELLQRIDLLAERISFPAFEWAAFALMTAGVVGFALQLVLAKLVVLSRMGFSLKEILSDALGLAISVIGLVLTTQAIAGDSAFAQRPSAVLSAAMAGVLAGLLHYLWGQAAEVQALLGRRQQRAAAERTRKAGNRARK